MDESTKSFEKFLLKEYENIAKAHFGSNRQFALFFRYYMLFISVPLLILSLVDKETQGTTNSLIDKTMFGYLLTVLAIIGLFFYWFVIKIWHEIILYARTVNGIRNYYYAKLTDKEKEKEIRALPLEKNKPPYESYFNPALLIIAIINSCYLSLGFKYLDLFSSSINTFIGLIILFFASHFIVNYWVTVRQNKMYN